MERVTSINQRYGFFNNKHLIILCNIRQRDLTNNGYKFYIPEIYLGLAKKAKRYSIYDTFFIFLITTIVHQFKGNPRQVYNMFTYVKQLLDFYGFEKLANSTFIWDNNGISTVLNVGNMLTTFDNKLLKHFNHNIYFFEKKYKQYTGGFENVGKH